MELDGTGFPQPTGEFEELAADSVVVALGQDSEPSLLRTRRTWPWTTAWCGSPTANLMTDRQGAFADGDLMPAERTVTVAVGQGKKAARHIDA
ncbi:hypothetical protein [Streptomyces sp. NPDC051576]|uniref:hypothetical protein n=1 Tax=Streptomyces sp. NPDC051576 TaxID=3155803 RepID=UPI003417EE6A